MCSSFGEKSPQQQPQRPYNQDSPPTNSSRTYEYDPKKSKSVDFAPQKTKKRSAVRIGNVIKVSFQCYSEHEDNQSPMKHFGPKPLGFEFLWAVMKMRIENIDFFAAESALHLGYTVASAFGSWTQAQINEASQPMPDGAVKTFKRQIAPQFRLCFL